MRTKQYIKPIVQVDSFVLQNLILAGSETESDPNTLSFSPKTGKQW